MSRLIHAMVSRKQVCAPRGSCRQNSGLKCDHGACSSRFRLSVHRHRSSVPLYLMQIGRGGRRTGGGSGGGGKSYHLSEKQLPYRGYFFFEHRFRTGVRKYQSSAATLTTRRWGLTSWRSVKCRRHTDELEKGRSQRADIMQTGDNNKFSE